MCILIFPFFCFFVLYYCFLSSLFCKCFTVRFLVITACSMFPSSKFSCCLLLVSRTDFYVIMTSPTDKMGFPPGVAKRHVIAVCFVLFCVICQLNALQELSCSVYWNVESFWHIRRIDHKQLLMYRHWIDSFVFISAYFVCFCFLTAYLL